MRVKEPHWWYREQASIPGVLLAPIGALWGMVAEYRYRSKRPYRPALPVICVGNFTAGGTGKTPIAIAIASMLKEMGETPAFLSRGYGGRVAGPHWVDPSTDKASDVGDEPLLLARMGPVMIARDRPAGAQAIELRSPKITAIIMDDGLQNGSLAKDLSLAVLDASRGIGNGRVIPAGPLRSNLEQQLERVDLVVSNGFSGSRRSLDTLLGRAIKPGIDVVRAATKPAADVGWLRGTRILAFTGIGSPQRFLAMLSSLGAEVAHSAIFPDHHEFQPPDAERLLRTARSLDAMLVTTEKDHVRMASSEAAIRELFLHSRVVPIVVEFDAADQLTLKARLESVLLKYRPASQSRRGEAPGSA